ncbi:TRAP transporter large permease subunit [Roseibium sp. MMSF_3544]|uniref:TRAP transporter large permease n=1 Tax=unclassified Roseibium TaxID=2629323 RepID=UPI00273DCB2F|nr:TRAP transporter large permease subunit [Roseibium sp. MMSF_3544]
MPIELISILLFGSVIVLMLIGVPIGVATGIVATVFLFDPDNLQLLVLMSGRIFSFINTYVLVSLPFFIFMATLMEKSGIADDLFNGMSLLGGAMPGGLAVMTMIVAVILASMTGVIGGEIMLLGMLALPQLLRHGYDENLAIGTIGAGGSLGTMIPPSINLIFFGLIANVAVGDLFKAAVVPGLLLGSLYILYIMGRCTINPKLGPPTGRERPSRGEVLSILFRLVPPLLVGGGVLGSIYLGIAAVTEAAALGAAAMIVVTALRGRLNFETLRKASMQTIETSGIVLWLVFGAISLIGVYNFLGGTTFIEKLYLDSDLSRAVLMGSILVIWCLLGLFMDGTSIALLTVPVFAPIASGLGYDLIWFGVMFAIACQIGYMTPPLGTAAFYMKTVTPPHIKLEKIFRSYLPFVCIQVLVLCVLWALPWLAMY